MYLFNNYMKVAYLLTGICKFMATWHLCLVKDLHQASGSTPFIPACHDFLTDQSNHVVMLLQRLLVRIAICSGGRTVRPIHFVRISVLKSGFSGSGLSDIVMAWAMRCAWQSRRIRNGYHFCLIHPRRNHSSSPTRIGCPLNYY
ncbi:hypothetical protein QQP08_000395 [Theobroma cacao]|uniref:Uncharacterized protein n=1 Tax=Theobroma cacao TaxID=3641 RepID=A0A061DG35_THECC|nr:Uncharacterized protein TCM_000038 [Theobroma cacao]WRX07908.1 hypothetical protein QQP08_000395 [Theobroma cacao]